MAGQRSRLTLQWCPLRYLELVDFVLKGRESLTERLEDLHLPSRLGQHGGLLVLYRRKRSCPSRARRERLRAARPDGRGWLAYGQGGQARLELRLALAVERFHLHSWHTRYLPRR